MNIGLLTALASPRRKLIQRTESTELRKIKVKSMPFELTNNFLRSNTLQS